MNLVELFCKVDDFCLQFSPIMKKHLIGHNHRNRSGQLSLSEIMTILILFHQSGYRHFKAFYLEHVCTHLREEFPKLVSYHRFVALMPRTVVPFMFFLKQNYGQCTGIAFIDSTHLSVCHNKRINRNKVFDGIAARGKSSLGWFYGLKLHLITNDLGELLACQITPGNVDDRKPVLKMTEDLWGKLFGDKGYVSKDLVQKLLENDLHLFTRFRKSMKPPLMTMTDKILLRRRAIIETVIDQLKNISQIEHTRHRSPVNALVNILCGLVAYCLKPTKPSLNIVHNPQLPILIHN